MTFYGKITFFRIGLLTCAGHGDDGPVEGLGQCVEHGVGLVLLQGVPQPGKDQHPHAHRHCQQQKLSVCEISTERQEDLHSTGFPQLFTPVAVLQSGAQGLKTSNVSGELENPQDPEDAKDLGRLGEMVEGIPTEAVEDQGEEEGEDPKEVDHIQEVEDEVPLVKVSTVKKWILPFLGKRRSGLCTPG